ncbi:MAG: serine hydrolase [Acidobacteriia bacterium]|nr:serine hydrolase [Terriglobia bacterium]
MKPLAALLLVPFAAAQQPLADAALSAEIRQASARLGAGVFLFAKNIDTGAWFGSREDEKVSTASTIKLPILATLFDKAAKGQLRWDETLELTAVSRVGGSGVLTEFSDGMRFPIRDLANLMIVVSDNTATNLILDRVSAESVNSYMDSLGLIQTRSLRKVLSGDPPKPSGWSKAGLFEANQRFGIGVSTPREMASLMELIANGKVVSPAASQQMIAILDRQHYKDGIGRRLGEFKVASKSGSLSGLRSDVALITTPKGRIAMAITVEGLKNSPFNADNPGLLLIADLARKLTNALVKTAP